MGSKARIAKHILPIMLAEAEKHGITKWVEPFVGGANSLQKVPKTFDRIGIDNNRFLIAMYQSLQKNGFCFLEDIDKEFYSNIRDCYNNSTTYTKDGDAVGDELIGWVGFMASANGRFFEGGYSGKSNTKVGTVRNYIDESIRGLKKEWDDIKGINFEHGTFSDFDFNNSLIYCDPPYKNTKQYSTSKGFDYDLFYDWCRKQKENGNIVFVSEYEMPEDFKEVWAQEVKSSLSANGVTGGNKVSVEKLFRVNGGFK